MSNFEEKRRYARQRHFDFINDSIENIEVLPRQHSSSIVNDNGEYEDKNDIYAQTADELIGRGKIDEAFELLFKSVEEYHNVESIAQIADLLSIIFIKEYGDTGYSGDDIQTNHLVESAIGFYIAYGMLTHDTARVREVVNTVGALFNNKTQFQTMLQRIRSKCENVTLEQLIDFFKH